MKTQRSPRFILNLLGFGTAISLLGDATLYTVLPLPAISAQLGITLTNVGLLLGANRAVRLLINGPVGLLYDRLPRRGLLVTALTLGAGASIFYALGYGLWPLLLGRIIWGLAWALLWIGSTSVVLDVSNEENRGRNSGILQMWFFIGVAISSFIGAILTDAFGFRNGQWFSVALIAVTALAWFILLPETRIAKPETDAAQNRSKNKKLPLGTLAGAAFTIFIARFMSWGILAATAILWLSEIFGDGAQLASIFIPIATLTGLYTALRSLTSIASTPIVGSISDKLGRRWPLIGATMALGSLGLWLMSGELPTLAIIGAFLIPIAGSTAETLVPAITGDHVPEGMRSRALGIINTAGDLGATIAPYLALRALNDGLLSLGGIYKIGSGLFALMAIIALVFLASRKTNKKI